MVVNMVELDHQPWALDPRAFLQRMVAAAAAKDLAFDAAFENEFFLAYRTDDGFVPVDRKPVLQRHRHGIDRAGHPGHHRGA
jgi:glutamine synthetase